MAKTATKVKAAEASNETSPPKKTTALANVSNTSTALTTTTEADEFGAMPNGLDNVTARDVIIPRMTVLQALSPQLIKSKPEFIKDALPGMFCDTATGDLYEGELLIVPCYFATIFLEWAPRSTGKGLVSNHGMDASILDKCTPDDKGRMTLKNGNYIAETATYYVLNMSAGGRRCFIPLTSTQLKASRRWMTQITAQKLRRSDGSEFTPPIFYRAWKASITENSNAEGSWFGWKFEPAQTIIELDPQKQLLAAAKEFFEMARDGLVKGDVTNVGDDQTSSGDNNGAM